MIIFDDFIDAQPVMINAKGDPKMNDPKMNEPSTSKVKELKSKASEQKKKARKGMNDFQWFAMQVLIFVIILYVLFAHIIGIMAMPNADMYPRIDSGDFLMYYRLDKDPKAQDVVVFEKNDTRYVGRVIAVQGDTVEITKDGAVIINGFMIGGNYA